MTKPYIDVGTRISAQSGTDYHVLQFLGAGGNSVVHLALATSGRYRGVAFALKFFTRLSEPERLARFEREMAFLQECSHPSIMSVYDSGVYYGRGEAKGFPFVVVEYLPETMSRLMRGPMATAERVSHTLQLLSALTYLHQHNPPVVHRDIKPQNIFIKRTSCVLGDFGLIKLLDENSESDELDLEILKESVGPGMPFFYRTPDLVAYAKGDIPITTKSDVFQLGLVVAEMFTGKNPQKKADDILDNVELDTLKFVAPSGALGKRVRDLIGSMLEFDPESRPSAQDLIDPWEGLFLEVVKRCSELNGRVF